MRLNYKPWGIDVHYCLTRLVAIVLITILGSIITNAQPDGEVEDYLVEIEGPQSTGTIIIKKITDPASTGIDFSFSSPHFLTVNSPLGIAATYQAGGATFGPPLDLTGIAGDLVLVDDGNGSTTDGCEALINGAAVNGKIAVIDRGLCAFVTKVQNAETAGAIAVIVINSQPGGGVITMGGTDPGITIPSIFISKEDGDLIKTELLSTTVNATLYSELGGNFTLQHSDMKTISNVPAGTYTVTEDNPFLDGYELTNITFVDPDNGSSGDLGTFTATIDLDALETVTCTFTNTFTDERCNLDPETDSREVNTQYTLTYTLAQNGNPFPGYPVTFTVVSGPNVGETAIDVITDVDGKAEFTYIGDGGPGTDIIEVNVFYDSFICQAEVTWQFPGTGTIIIKKITDPASTGIDFSFSSPHFLTVNSPLGIAATYQAGGATFGPPLDLTGIAGDLVLVDDGNGSTTDGCEALINGAAVNGKIAVIDRGLCAFVTKVQNAETAGAIAVIVINSQPGGGVITMGGTDPGITIPSIFISKEDGDLIKTELLSTTVNATLYSELGGNFTLQHSDMKTISNVPAGTYTVTEDNPFLDGYELTNITFVDPDNGSSGDLGTFTATIDLDALETVTCTFTNTFTDERCNLDPETDSREVNTQYTLTYTLAQNGNPFPGYPVTFTVVSGPNVGETAIDVITDVDGKAEFTYIGDGGPGTDIIEVNVFYDSFICQAEVTWQFPGTGTIIIKKITDPASTGIDFSFSSPHFLTVNSPLGIAATYQAGGATFGPPLDLTGIAGDLVLVDDGNGSTTDGCEALINGAAVNGKIAVIDRGLCAFVTKVQNAETAGAIAVIVINSQPGGGVITMGGTDPGITIPSIFISKEDGDLIKTELLSTTVNATLYSELGGNFTLQHSDMKTISNVPAGTYTVTEDNPFLDGYELTNITFVDPDNGSSGDLGTFTATIDLDALETVTCTFTNTFTDERCNLDPETDTKQLNQQYTLTYTLAQNGNPFPGYPVTFTVVSGPNVGETAIDVITDVDGKAEFTYIGDGGPGTDIIEVNVFYDSFICQVEVTWQFPFMTIWSVNDDTDGKLQYYTLDATVSAFLNIEGDIEGIEGPKDLEDLIIDFAGNNGNSLQNLGVYSDATFYLVNNVGTSTIYSLDFNEFDNNPATPVTATLVGSTGLPTDPNDDAPEEISSLLSYNYKLYGLSKRTKKLYEISKVDGSINQIFTLNVAGDFRTDGMTYMPPQPPDGNTTAPTTGGTVYLLKTNDTGGESEIWKFDTFPSGDISYVRQIETSGKVEALSAHPNGFLYASDIATLYEISVTDPYIGYLADYTVDIEGMDYFFELELFCPVAPTLAFIPIVPTPVELVSFTAEAKSGKVILNWETATEVNNYGFEVERQVGSKQSAVGNWEKIAFVDGHGNSNSPKSYSFSDNNPSGGTKFNYRLKQIDNDGTYEYSDIVEVEFVPTEFALYQNYPNPFNPTTKIKYSLPNETAVTIKVFDILGEEVMTLVNEKQEAGSYDVSVNGSNLGSGIYFYQMQAGEFSNTKKMLILK